MRVTPADIRQQSFSVRFRGFDPQEVDSFLEDVAVDLEAALKENALLKEQLAAVEERSRGMAEREKLLQETLVTTHRLAEDMREATRREMEQHLKETERQREAILESARREEGRLREDVQALKRVRHQLVEELHAAIDTAQRWIAEREGDAPEASPEA
jgi:cell division initiation protein